MDIPDPFGQRHQTHHFWKKVKLKFLVQNRSEYYY